MNKLIIILIFIFGLLKINFGQDIYTPVIPVIPQIINTPNGIPNCTDVNIYNNVLINNNIYYSTPYDYYYPRYYGYPRYYYTR